jgi:hypothetical protein
MLYGPTRCGRAPTKPDLWTHLDGHLLLIRLAPSPITRLDDFSQSPNNFLNARMELRIAFSDAAGGATFFKLCVVRPIHERRASLPTFILPYFTSLLLWTFMDLQWDNGNFGNAVLLGGGPRWTTSEPRRILTIPWRLPFIGSVGASMRASPWQIYG